MTINSNLTLGGSAVFELNRTNTPANSDRVAGLASVVPYELALRQAEATFNRARSAHELAAAQAKRFAELTATRSVSAQEASEAQLRRDMAQQERLERITTAANHLLAILNDILLPELEKHQVRFIRRRHWNTKIKAWVRKFFRDEIAPIITPRITRAPRMPQNSTRC